ncbi:MAG: stage II sporulation protein R [Clostridia bacterium]|nr:stage II sporulation protein R [Clostridia bacterium]
MKIRKIEIAVICGLIIAILAGSISGFSAFAAQCSDVRQEVFRLHILANSDSTQDQALKLKVRDKLLDASTTLFGKADSKQQVIATVKAHLGEIQSIAQKEVNREGYSYKVNAQVVNMYFTTRTYNNVTLPAGWYDALRITIGKGQGHNWWCVMFPPLCLPAAEKGTQFNDVFGGRQAIFEGYSKPDIKIEFKIVEWIESIKEFFTK